jgi:hypothetical protein
MLRSLLITSLWLVFILPVSAKQTNSFEVTPLIGYRLGGDFDTTNKENKSTLKLTDEISYGLITAWTYDHSMQGELLISHYNTNFSQSSGLESFKNDDLGITYVHLGGNVAIPQSNLPIFVTGGLGFTYLSPQDDQLDTETRFSMNLGLTTKIPLSKSLSFQLGGRVYGTFFNSDSSVFCNQTNCLISISSNIWVQTEVKAGLTFAF